MAFLDETGLTYFWQQILIKLNSYIPSTRKINNKTLANDINLTASDIGALPNTYTPPNQTAQQVGADPAGTAASAVSQHNMDATSHNDLRLALKGLTDRINAALDSDDTTLDQMSEVVAYIKSNKSLIDAITTSKVNVSDIVNNLTTDISNKPLSAAQGVALKELIDALRNDKLDAAELTNAVNTALAQAKASGEFDGPQGPAGPKGEKGEKGDTGADGKTAYQYAQDGGYTGTETEFAAKLAQEQLTGTTNELTPIQVYEAVSAGIPVKVQYTDSTYGLLSFTAFNVAETLDVIVSQTIVNYNGVYTLAELYGVKSNNTWGLVVTALAEKTDIPSALPNPNSIHFTGASTGTYDGSSALTINIPESGADAYTQFTQVAISLPLSGWTGSSTFTNTIAISSVKADTIVIASPAPSDKDAFAFSNVYCSAQAESSLTFTAKTKPTTDLTANLIIVTLPEGATATANTCNLTVAGWSSNTQTVNVTGMTTDRIAIIGPVADSIDVCKTNAVYCSAQGNGTLTFKCQTTPSVAITMNVIMI